MRSPIEDANAGTTRTARIRRESPTLASTNEVSDKRGLEDLAPIIEMTTQALSQAKGSIDKSAAESAALRQGANEGINEIDKANKRTGFAAAIFGQDAGYSTAMNIAVSNKASNAYLEQMASVEQHADKTPEEYGRYLNQTVVKQFDELYKDDSLAQATAKNNWNQLSRKLAREQAANHMVFTQQQTFAQGVRDMTQQFDDVSLSSSAGRTEASQLEAQQDLDGLLSKDYTYVAEDGTVASKQASRNIQLTSVMQQMEAGNMHVFKNLPENFTDGLTVPQMEKLDSAKGKYDIAISRGNEVIVEDGLLAAENGDVGVLERNIIKLGQRRSALSGTDYSVEKWTEDKRRLQAGMNSMLSRQATQSVKQEQAANYYRARENNNPGQQGEYYSKAAEAGADDAVVLQQANVINSRDGVEPPRSMAEAINTVLHSPRAMAGVADRAERYGSISEPFAEAVKKRVLNMQPTETGYVSAVDLDQLENLRTLYDKAPGEMRKAVGDDASAMIEITLNNSRQPVKEIQHKRAQYVKNKSIQLSKQELNIPPEQTMGDYVKQQLGDGYLDPSAINYYQERLQTGYKIYDGDTRAAVNYMKQQYKTNNQHWKGKVIVNAGLREGANIPQALNYLESTAGAEALIKTQIPATSDGKAIRSFSELNDVQFRVNPGTEELIISSSQFSYPIVIKEQTFAVLAAKSNAAENTIQSERIKARNAILQQESQQYWPNPNDKSKRPAGLPELTDAEKVGPTKSW